MGPGLRRVAVVPEGENTNQPASLPLRINGKVLTFVFYDLEVYWKKI